MLTPSIKSKITTLIGDKLTCPADMSGLNKIIALKNKLTKQLNNIYKGIEQIEKFISIPEKVISTSEKAIPPIQTVIDVVGFIPSTPVTPNPTSPIVIAQKGIDKLKNLITVSKVKIGGGAFQLNFLKEELQKVLTLLDMLDLIIELCAQELVTCNLPDGTTQQMTEEACLAAGGTIGTDIEDDGMLVQAQVSQELIASTQNQSNQLSPVVTNVNGFDMEVETEITGDPLKRRRAVAKNTQGVVVLKGEYSYSSNDQILIDELVFYIQQNNLKAE